MVTDSIAISFETDDSVTDQAKLLEKHNLFEISTSEYHPELYDETNKIDLGNFETEISKTLDLREFAAFGAKFYAHTCGNEEESKRNPELQH